jgi:pyruvate dehydrogenase E2 component (dihydrolipoamide acetyltransferase)
MASRVVMPKLSDTMEEGKILRWLKKEGDPVETGQTLAEIETDKATVEMEAYTSGVIRKLVVAEGETVKVGGLIGVIGAADEDVSALLSEEPSVPVAATPHAVPRPAASAPPATGAIPPPTPAEPVVGRALKASPLALRMAAESGVDLKDIVGTGPQGRIVKRDIEAALGAARASSKAAEPSPVASLGPVSPGAGATEPLEVQAVELSSIRRTIAKRLVQSKGPIPHFYLTVDVAVDRLWADYQALRADESPVSLTDIVVKAAAAALRRHPEMNASFAGDHVKQYGRVHIGLAVALNDGLITPVVRDADRKPLDTIARETAVLIERARAHKLQPDDYTGATFSVSNLGMMGIEEFSAIINPPEAAILAVGAVRKTPVVDGDVLRIGRRMKLTLSVDHRVADGATAARFLQTLTRMLENPLLMG